jgi:hypothetical protein
MIKDKELNEYTEWQENPQIGKIQENFDIRCKKASFQTRRIYNDNYEEWMNTQLTMKLVKSDGGVVPNTKRRKKSQRWI